MIRRHALVERRNGARNKLLSQDRAAHEWYRFVLSFPPHLVREYLERFEVSAEQRVLDPFCGTGTTLVECKKLGIPSVGIEGNPMAWYASKVKTDWSPDPDALVSHACGVADRVLAQFRAEGIEDEFFRPQNARKPDGLKTLPEAQAKLLLTNSISPLPLHKTLVLAEALESGRDDRFYDHERLALARALVQSIGNLHFGPEVGIGPIKADTQVVAPWLDIVHVIAGDLHALRPLAGPPCSVHLGDARSPAGFLEPESVDAVITSPPYPNEKDYTRTTRLESVILGLIRDKTDLRELKKGLVRSNTRGVFVTDEDDQWLTDCPEVHRIAEQIEARRVELGKTSGFERLYARVTKLYFGGMARHLQNMTTALRPGAHLAYVVGDQASYLRVLIRTGQILADIAEHLGYEVVGLDLFRTRLATATREQLREEVLVLHWPGTRAAGSASAIAENAQKYRKKSGGKLKRAAPSRLHPRNTIGLFPRAN